METREWTYIDRIGWASGEWDSEPDKIQWQNETTELPCLIVRNHLGSLCGYVGIDNQHPLFGQHYDKPDVEVHGGLTFSDSCDAVSPEHGICHIPGEGEPDNVWWFGFDCNHCFDYAPGMYSGSQGARFPRLEGETYKNVAYVRAECSKLAAQLKAIKGGEGCK
jgi:hypothetical protein